MAGALHFAEYIEQVDKEDLITTASLKNKQKRPSLLLYSLILNVYTSLFVLLSYNVCKAQVGGGVSSDTSQTFSQASKPGAKL